MTSGHPAQAIRASSVSSVVEQAPRPEEHSELASSSRPSRSKCSSIVETKTSETPLVAAMARTVLPSRS